MRYVEGAPSRGLDGAAQLVVLARQQGPAQFAQVNGIAADLGEHRPSDGEIRPEQCPLSQLGGLGAVIEQGDWCPQPWVVVSRGAKPSRHRGLPACDDGTASQGDRRVGENGPQRVEPAGADVHIVVGEDQNLAGRSADRARDGV